MSAAGNPTDYYCRRFLFDGEHIRRSHPFVVLRLFIASFIRKIVRVVFLRHTLENLVRDTPAHFRFLYHRSDIKKINKNK